MVNLLCCAYASTAPDPLEQIQTNFLRAEQLAAYLRLADGNESFLGITRAKANFDKRQFSLGKEERAQILSNQLSYGLWGLYSTAMQVAGLISGAERRSTEQGRTLVSEMVMCLGEDQWQAFTALAQRSELRLADFETLDRLLFTFHHEGRKQSVEWSLSGSHVIFSSVVLDIQQTLALTQTDKTVSACPLITHTLKRNLSFDLVDFHINHHGQLAVRACHPIVHLNNEELEFIACSVASEADRLEQILLGLVGSD